MEGGALFREAGDATQSLYERVVDLTGDAVYQLDTDGRILAVDDNGLALLGRDRDEVTGEHASEFLRANDYERVEATIQEVLAGSVEEPVSREVTVTPDDGEPVACEIRLGVVRDDGEFAGTVGIVRDVSERIRRERTLERQRDRLARLDRINRIVRGVDRALVRASTRRDVESAVCDRLTQSDAYRYAWIADVPGDGGDVSVRDDGSIPADLVAVGDEDVRCERCLVERAARTGALQTGLPEECALTSARLAATLDGGAMACVPLEHEGRRFGVLVLYADDERITDERELALLDELGATVANALRATELREAMFSETVVELTVESSCPDRFIAGLSAAAETEVSFEGTVASDCGAVRYYVTVEDDDPAVASEVAAERDQVQSVAVVTEYDDAYLLEATYEDDAMLSILGAFGGQITEAVATDGVVRAQIELPQQVNVREVLAELRTILPEVEVVAQRESQRPLQTPRQFRSAIAEELTERQRTVLATAYYNGFFEWPRASTGEEIAERLDVAAATFHYHLRAAEQTVVGAALGDGE